MYAKDFTLTIDQISNGAIGLMEEVSRSKITGEEETFSHTDLLGLPGQRRGRARSPTASSATSPRPRAAPASRSSASSTPSSPPIAEAARPVQDGDGFVSYTELSTAQVKELSDQVNALSEPLSQLTSIIVK